MKNIFNIITFGIFSKDKKATDLKNLIDALVDAEIEFSEEENTKKKYKIIAVIDECDNEKDALKMVLFLNAKRDGLNYTYKMV